MTATTLTTDRLRLEPLSHHHFTGIATILQDRQTMSYYPQNFDAAAVTAWIDRSREFWTKHNYGRFAVIRLSDNLLIGDAGLMHLSVNDRDVNDIGWIFHRQHWGDGYATEAAAAIRDDAFERLGLPVLHAGMPVDHPASRRVAERIGMTEITRFRNTRNRDIETHMMELTISRYREITGQRQISPKE